MTDRYWEAVEPGAGRRAPRADAVTDARTMSLNGTWRFRLAPTAAGTGPAFVERDFDDSSWDELRIPSHWVLEEVTPLAGGPARSHARHRRGTALHEHGAARCRSTLRARPTENPTGDHRLDFTVPDDWGDAVLRFQGVDSCAKAWLNGEELGWSTGSRLPFEFDAPVVPGENVLAVRVHRWSSGTYLEDQDMWWLPGIFRDVELIERPRRSHRRPHRTCRLRPRDGPRHAAHRGIGARRRGDPRARHPHGRRRDGDRRRRTVERGVASPVPRHADRGGRRRDDRPRDRLPHGRHRRRRAARERPPGVLPRREPARAPPRHGPHARPRDDAPRHPADEAAQRERGAHEPLPAASRVPAALRRVRAVGRRGVRPRDARLHLRRVGGQPARGSRMAAGDARPHGAHGRARQEPAERRRVVDGERELGRRELRCARGVDPRARPLASDPLRARPELPQLRLRVAHVPVAGAPRADRPPRGPAPRRRDRRRGRAPPHPPLPALRVRARDGQRAGLARRLPPHPAGARAVLRRLRLGVDRPRLHPCGCRGPVVHHARHGCRLRARTAAATASTGSSSPTARRSPRSPSSRRRSRPWNCTSAPTGSWCATATTSRSRASRAWPGDSRSTASSAPAASSTCRRSRRASR